MVTVYGILSEVEAIDIAGCLKVLVCEEGQDKSELRLQNLMTEQGKLIAIDKQLRELRKEKPELEKNCTELLRNINYAANIYLPKQRRLGTSLMKEAVEYLKYEIACMAAKVSEPDLEVTEIREEYTKERKECFHEIADIEIELCRTERLDKDNTTKKAEILKRRESVFEKLNVIVKKAVDSIAIKCSLKTNFRGVTVG
ncbi:hypothetical protein [Methanosarcina mazei]|nr:hypothetical protein [Methanosarcina mazei]WIM42687.1 hypothetical protein PSF70_14495 [Methanosarcina mazei]WIM46148.1 hypothetical protein PQQ20_14385 [Methanosarcina mazei]